MTVHAISVRIMGSVFGFVIISMAMSSTPKLKNKAKNERAPFSSANKDHQYK